MPSVVPGVKYDTKLMELGKAKQSQLEMLLRKEFQVLAKDDSVVADMMYKNLLAQDSKSAIGAHWELKQASRLAVRTEGEKAMAKVFAGKVTLAEGIDALEHSTAYLQVRGAKLGKVVDEVPAVTYLADTVKAGTKIELNAKGILVGKVQTVIKPTGFNILKAGHTDTEIRTAWARQYFHPKEGTIIEASDIPLLDAAYGKVVSEGYPIPLIKTGDITFQPADAKEFFDAIRSFKVDVAYSHLSGLGFRHLFQIFLFNLLEFFA